MSIESRCELENTREKLHLMEELFEKVRQEPTDNALVRQWTLRSLKNRINQFTEEIVRFESRLHSPAPDDCKRR